MKLGWAGLAVCAALVAPGTAMASSGNSGPRAQASMLVTGTIVVNPNGSVASYVMDKPDKLPPGVKKELAKAVPQWKFRPVVRDGTAVIAKSHMSVRLVARPVGSGKYTIGIRSAYFGQCKSGACLTANKRTPPTYPQRLRRELRPMGFHTHAYMATVYLEILVGQDGTAQKVAVRQVNLGVKGRKWQMKRWRHAFAQTSVAAAKHWTFHVPVKRPLAGRGKWVATTAVIFGVHAWGYRRPRGGHYGQWRIYLPGPRHFIPWMHQQLLAAGGADAIPTGGGLYPARQTLHLISSLGGP